MKCVGRYTVLCSNSFDKKLWKEYGIETRDEQMNMLIHTASFYYGILAQGRKLYHG